MYRILILIFGCIGFSYENYTNENYTRFSEDFRFGVATASYQIEGAWNLSGKGENVWDHFTHYQSDKIKDGSNGDVACDSYHKYKTDVQMLVELGVQFYRFSISWSRILPLGFSYKVNQEGLDYYSNLIDELLKYNIQPMVTLFHWDTPQVFQEMGGWTNPIIVDYFEDYARIVFENYGDRVKEWITFNEPYNMCLFGYGARNGFVVFAPDLNIHGVAEYECAHNVLKAHARAYHLYNDTFRATQKGKVSMASVILWAEPETNTTEAELIAEKALQYNVSSNRLSKGPLWRTWSHEVNERHSPRPLDIFQMGWMCHPIFTQEGDYPKVMRDEIDMLSKEQGFTKSRLPRFTQEEVEYIRGTHDYFAINYYTAAIYHKGAGRSARVVPSQENDLGYFFYQKDDWESGESPWLKLRPDGFRSALNWISKRYGNPEIYITENGYSSKEGLNDPGRVRYFNIHLRAILQAIEDGCNITAYTAWSLMDNFEWTGGYTERFGLYQVDFGSKNKTRTPRMSALVYKEIIRTRKIDPSYLPCQHETTAEKMDNLWSSLVILLAVVSVVLTSVASHLVLRSIWTNCAKKKIEGYRSAPNRI